MACVELDLGVLSMQPTRDNSYRPLSELPEADFDLSVVVPEDTPWQAIGETVLAVGGPVDRVAFVDEFRGAWVPAGYKSTTLRVTLRPTRTTLRAEDIEAVRIQVLAALAVKLGARLREQGGD